MNKTIILKVLVGSKAHKLDTSKSDTDYRGVFVVPTVDLLKIGSNTKSTHWIEGKTDDTQWEIGKFLMLATKCNPTILETFLAPMTYNNSPFGYDLQQLFPYIWNSIGVKNAFIGYGLNQRKKFLERKDNRAPKYAVAYLRSLYNAWELLTSNEEFSVDMTKTPIYNTLKDWKAEIYTFGEVINITEEWKDKVDEAYEKNPDKTTDLDKVNNYLLNIREKFWSK